jgi:hypothetical protein
MKCLRCYKGWIRTTVHRTFGTLSSVDVMCPDCLGNFNAAMSYAHRRVYFDPDCKKVVSVPGSNPCLSDPIEAKCTDLY